MSVEASMPGSLTGLALAIGMVALTWPRARRQFKLWTGLQTVKAGLSLLLYFALALLWIPLTYLLSAPVPSGRQSSIDSVAMPLGMLFWILFLLLWLIRYWFRILPTHGNAPPPWLVRFSIADVLCLLAVGACIVALLATRFV